MNTLFSEKCESILEADKVQGKKNNCRAYLQKKMKNQTLWKNIFPKIVTQTYMWKSSVQWKIAERNYLEK